MLLTEGLPILGFIACVGLATYAQNLTGFAFSLVLLGLSAVLHTASVADAANAAMVLQLINGWTFFRAEPLPPPWRRMRPTLIGSLCGVAIGVALLGWLSGSAVAWLRALLGVSILACAVILLLQARPLARLSSPASFAVVGALAGVLGGLFASSGPPLVYQMYRQPLSRDDIRRGLLLVFAVNSLVRLALVLASGQFSARAALLAACAMPVVWGVTRLHRRHPPTLGLPTLRRIVAGLLFVSGTTLLFSAYRAIVATLPAG